MFFYFNVNCHETEANNIVLRFLFASQYFLFNNFFFFFFSLINKEVPSIPDQDPKIKYKIPMSLVFVENNHFCRGMTKYLSNRLQMCS